MKRIQFPDNFVSGFEISDVLRISDKDYSITFGLYFSVEWLEPRMNLRNGFKSEENLISCSYITLGLVLSLESLCKTYILKPDVIVRNYGARATLPAIKNSSQVIENSDTFNDLTIGWQNLNLLSHPNATLAPQARASSDNLNYVTLQSCSAKSEFFLNI